MVDIVKEAQGVVLRAAKRRDKLFFAWRREA
jgi:hypothetical protein